jgi:DUF971 family protein
MDLSPVQPTVTEMTLHQLSRVLAITFDDGAHFELPCEYLRVYSPSAEVRGHGPGQGVLETGKETVNVMAIEPVGHYAVKLVFDDGHSTGLYSWQYLYELAVNQTEYWREYLDALKRAGIERRP